MKKLAKGREARYILLERRSPIVHCLLFLGHCSCVDGVALFIH